LPILRGGRAAPLDSLVFLSMAAFEKSAAFRQHAGNFLIPGAILPQKPATFRRHALKQDYASFL
jgi:hypothetical protein